jgi:hypothetical protein
MCSEVVIAGNKVTLRLPDVHPSQRSRSEPGFSGRVSSGMPSEGEGVPRGSSTESFNDSSFRRSSSLGEGVGGRDGSGGSGGGSHSIVMTVPNGAIPWIIGKKGAKITEIQRSSGARVKVQHDQAGPEVTDITLFGTDAMCTAAKMEITEVVDQFIYNANRAAGHVVTPQHRPRHVGDATPSPASPIARLDLMEMHGSRSDVSGKPASSSPFSTNIHSGISPSSNHSIPKEEEVDVLQVLMAKYEVTCAMQIDSLRRSAYAESRYVRCLCRLSRSFSPKFEEPRVLS